MTPRTALSAASERTSVPAISTLMHPAPGDPRPDLAGRRIRGSRHPAGRGLRPRAIAEIAGRSRMKDAGRSSTGPPRRSPTPRAPGRPSRTGRGCPARHVHDAVVSRTVVTTGSQQLLVPGRRGPARSRRHRAGRVADLLRLPGRPGVARGRVLGVETDEGGTADRRPGRDARRPRGARPARSRQADLHHQRALQPHRTEPGRRPPRAAGRAGRTSGRSDRTGSSSSKTPPIAA